MFAQAFSLFGGQVIMHIEFLTILSDQLPSGLYVMYTHMLSQRRKVLGLGIKKTQ